MELSPVAETIIKTINAYDQKGAALVLSRSDEALIEGLIKSGHALMVLAEPGEEIQKLIDGYPEAEIIQWDYSSGVLPGTIDGRKFKFVVTTNEMRNIPENNIKQLIQSIEDSLLSEGGILFIGGRIAKWEDRKKDGDNLSYEFIKEDFPSVIFQQITSDSAILAMPKGKRVYEEEALEENAKEENNTEEKKEETKQKEEEESKPAYTEPDPEIVKKWERVRDIPGKTMLELGNNFLAALRPYEKEVVSNWSLYAKRLQNLFGGTFTNDDIIQFRASAVTNYYKASNATITKDSDYCEWLARLYAAVFLRQRFPGEKIGVNLYGLYHGISSDLKMIFVKVGENYDDINPLRAEIDNIKGTRLSELLLTGFSHKRY